MNMQGEITLGEVGLSARPYVERYLSLAALALILLSGWFYVEGKADAWAFLIVAISSLLPAFFWLRSSSPGIPLTTMMGVQALVIYGTPLAVNNPSLSQYPAADVFQAAIEVAVFGASLAFGWLFVFHNFSSARPRHCWRFEFLKEGSPRHSSILPILLLGAGTLFLTAHLLHLLAKVPTGVFSIARTLFDATSIAGGILGGYNIARRVTTGVGKFAYSVLFLLHCAFTAYNYTLFPATSLIIALVAGLFIGGGRIPVFVLAVLLSVFAFLNLSKFEMRGAYWEPGQAYAYQKLADLPDRYSEWVTRSWEILTDAEESQFDQANRSEQTLSDRINNLENILVAQDAFKYRGLEPVRGESYFVIPALLIPRLLWPDKPRTHEGMVLLNVYFGRQTREESLVTYISWGLLPESYANFGPWLGAIFCGLLLGAATAWLEFWSRPFPITALESVIFMLLVVQCGTSFESVASVWLTSIFQMLVAVGIGASFFVQRAPLPTTAP